ncbi:sensor histidine kinase [Pseudalkalibacillus berkeleyi]|uniref:histidine kinase n=1 Tax=Pseudalkalibacillus berkeleyi TaxID=1069813 RepID=A0ABS9GU16_9BACL|nr:HAMP domain-containing sensor histidine kinase [Pseudalkalibacillus berkeleyi]MCF6136333.1 HAMP domain-containing histidine kinase [Pseudalkalibacillus berkeleyi]
MKVKYFHQLLGSHISILILSFLLLSLLFTRVVEGYVFQNKVDELKSYGNQILNEKSAFERKPGSKPTLAHYIQLLRARDIDFVTFDKEGTITSPMRGISGLRLSGPEWEKLSNGETISVKQDVKRFDQEVTLVAFPKMNGDQLLGGVMLISPISGTREFIQQLNKFLIFTMLASLVIASLLSWFLSKYHGRRILRLRNAASQIASGNYAVQLPYKDTDEIGELTKDFNAMTKQLKASAEEIDRLEARRRKFISDVSHEMRTPLTTIRGIIEGIRNDMIPAHDKEKSMNLVEKETKRLIRLVNENLDYEKIRSNQIKLEKENISVIELFEVIKEQLSLQAEEKENKIIISASDNLRVNADYDRLVQILLNITQNSLQFTTNGRIELRGVDGNEETVIEIEDNGIGIDPEDIESIWDRFYKADLSRKNNPLGEFGLGLSIVKQLVEFHKGTIEVESSKGKGTKFTIRLPKKE